MTALKKVSDFGITMKEAEDRTKELATAADPTIKRRRDLGKAIVFYCKDCGELFFATVRSERNVRDVGEQIINYLAEGHEIKEVDINDDDIKLGHCQC